MFHIWVCVGGCVCGCSMCVGSSVVLILILCNLFIFTMGLHTRKSSPDQCGFPKSRVPYTKEQSRSMWISKVQINVGFPKSRSMWISKVQINVIIQNPDQCGFPKSRSMWISKAQINVNFQNPDQCCTDLDLRSPVESPYVN